MVADMAADMEVHMGLWDLKSRKKIELSANFPQFLLLRTRKISHTDLIGLAWISHTAHRTQRVHIGKNISVIFSMINMEV